MPECKQRNIKIFSIYDEIFNIHQAVLKEMNLLEEKESLALSSIQPSSEMQVGDGFTDKARRWFEHVLSKPMGGHEKVLPYCKVDMDTGSDALYMGYQDFWMDHMREVEKIPPHQIEKPDIDNPCVLIMEFCLRLAMQALRLDSPLRSDQKRRIFIDILTRFGVALSKKGILSINLQARLFDDHKKWLDILAETADKIDKMNISKPVLKENLKFLKSLENNIIRHLVMCLTDKDLAKKDVWEDSLSDSQLNVTLRQCEKRILDAAAKKGLIKAGGIVAKGIIETSVVVQRSTLPKYDNELSENDFLEYDLTATCGIGIPDTHRQKHVIGYFDNTPIQLKVKYLYGLGNKTKIIRRFLGKIDNMVQSAGWLPFLFHVVELGEVDAVIRFQAKLCSKVFEICKKDYHQLFNTYLGKELGECTALSEMPQSLPKLELLQDPELLSTVFTNMALDFSELGKMGAWLGCRVTENPYLERAVRIISAAPTQALSVKTITETNRLAIKSSESSIDIGSSQPTRIIKLKKTLSFQKSESERPKLNVPRTSPADSQPEPPKRRNKSNSLGGGDSLESIRIKEKQIKEKSEKIKLFRESGSNIQIIKTPPEQMKSPPPEPPPPTPPFPFNKKPKSEPISPANSSPTLSRHLSIPEKSSNTQSESPARTPFSRFPTIDSDTALPLVDDDLSDLPTTNTSLQEKPSNLEVVIQSSPENKDIPPAKALPEKTGSSSQPQTPFKNLFAKKPASSKKPHLFLNSSDPEISNKGVISDNPQVSKVEEPYVTIEMPLVSNIYPQQVEEEQTEKDRIYLATVPYIEVLVNSLKLSVAQIAEGTNIFDTNKGYFKQGNFSPFRQEVAKEVQAFFCSYIGFKAPKGSVFIDHRAIWEQRSEEITMLKYFCTGPIDDSYLLLFIHRMITLTVRTAYLGPLSEYNKVITSLEKLLDFYYHEKLEAFLEYNIDSALRVELEMLRTQHQQVSEENIKLREDLKTSETKAGYLQEENRALQSQYVKGMNSLQNQVGKLGEKVEEMNQRSEFGPLFKPAAPKNHSQPSLEDPEGYNCTIL